MSSTSVASAVDKNHELKSLQEGVKLSQQKIVERVKDEINNSVEELAAGKKVVEVVNIGCLSHLAKLFCSWAVKTVAEEVDLSGSVVAGIVDSAEAVVEAVVRAADLSGNCCDALEAALEKELSHVTGLDISISDVKPETVAASVVASVPVTVASVAAAVSVPASVPVVPASVLYLTPVSIQNKSSRQRRE
jgi:hypothetical protein